MLTKQAQNLPALMAPGNAPIEGRTKALSPKLARQKMRSRKAPQNVFKPNDFHLLTAARPKVHLKKSVSSFSQEDIDVDKVYMHVKNTIKFLPTFGSQKGALGCETEGYGNSFDQAALMKSYLGAYFSKLMFGELKLTAQQAADWLGTDPLNILSSRDVLANGGIPVEVVTDEVTEEQFLVFSHVWLKVDLTGLGDWYAFDPSFKTYTTISGIDLQTISGYDQTSFHDAVLDGATVTADYYKDINTTAMATQLETMASNIQTWINTNKPDATIDDLVGTRNIVETTDAVRDLVHPYQDPDSTPVEWDEVPDLYKATLNIQYDNIDATFFSQDIAGKRMTLVFDEALHAQLRLNGALVAESTAQGPGTFNSVLQSIEHPYGATWADQSFWQRIWTGKYYILANGWGNTGPEVAYQHQKTLADNLSGGGADTDEDVVGESLSAIWHHWNAQKSANCDLIGRMSNCTVALHHQVGVVGWFDTPLIDIGGVALTVTENNADHAKEPWVNTLIAVRGVGLESAIMSQVANVEGVSSNTVLDQANNAGQKLFIADSSNWTSQVRPNLTNYPAQVLNDLENGYISAGFKVLIHEDGSTVQNQYNGYGFFAFNPFGGAVGIISGFLLGGGGSETLSLASLNQNAWENNIKIDKLDKVEVDYKVDQFTGNFTYQHTDLTIGSPGSPGALSFTRTHNSSDRNKVTTLGRGWRHNFMMEALEGKQAYAAFGNYSGAGSVPNVIYTMVGLLESGPMGFVVTSFTTNQLTGKITDNIVTVTGGPDTYVFTQVSAGNYIRPKGTNVSLTKAAGKFVMENFDGVRWTFRAIDGKIEKIEHPTGLVTTFEYSGEFTNFHLLSVSNNLGRTLTLNYETPVGLIHFLKSVQGGGKTILLNVDIPTGKLTSARNAASGLTSYLYDEKYRMTSYQMPDSGFVTNTYDEKDRVIRQQNPKNHTDFQYLGNVTRATSGIGGASDLPGARVIVTVFNTDGKPTSVYNGQPLPGPVAGNAASVSYSYDGLGRQRQVSYTDGHTIEMTFDDYNRVTSKTHYPSGGGPTIGESFGYTGSLSPWSVHIDFNGNMTTRSVGSGGIILGETGPEVNGVSPTKSWTYSGYGLVDVYTDPTGMRTKHFHSSGELTGIIVDEGEGGLNLTTTFTRDEVGNVTSMTNPRGHTTTAEYDLLRRCTKKTSAAPFLFERRFTFDVMGNMLTVQRQTNGSPAWQTETMTYSSSNKLVTTTDPLNNVTTNVYGAVDQLWKVTDAENRTTEHQYDTALRLIKVIDPMNIVAEERTYDQNDKLLTVKDGRGNVSTYLYNGLDRKQRLTYPDSSYEEWGYDNNGNVTSFRTRSGDVISYTFDALNRMTSRSPAGQATVSLTYDLAGRLLTASTPTESGNPASGTFTRTYDSAGRLASETNPQSQTVSYELDANGNTTRISYPGGFFVDYVFDQLDRMTNVKINGSAGSGASFLYDALSRRTRMSYSNSVVMNYGFDIGNNRTSMIVSFSGSLANWTYAFNKVHQMVDQNTATAFSFVPEVTRTTAYGTVNNMNMYPTVGGVAYSYNADGCLLTDTVWTYGYNCENMLTSAAKTAVSLSFHYDPFLRQIHKVSGSGERRYVYSGDQLIAEYDNATGDLVKRYVYADGIDDPLAQADSAGGVEFLHQDQVGSIVARTNNSGDVLDRYKYSPFGEISSLDGTVFGFTGQRFDEESGLYHFKRRYYSPAIGRFLQPDSIGYKAGLNMYRYGRNDPMNFVDPAGTWEEDIRGRYAHQVHQPTKVYTPHEMSAKITGEIILGGLIAGAIGKIAGAIGNLVSRERITVNAEPSFGGNVTVSEGANVPYRSGARVPEGYKPKYYPRDPITDALEGLPRAERGNALIPISDHPHSTLGTRLKPSSGEAPYPQFVEWGSNGIPIRRGDFTNHMRPGPDHPNPHYHNSIPGSSPSFEKGHGKPVEWQ